MWHTNGALFLKPTDLIPTLYSTTTANPKENLQMMI